MPVAPGPVTLDRLASIDPLPICRSRAPDKERSVVDDGRKLRAFAGRKVRGVVAG